MSAMVDQAANIYEKVKNYLETSLEIYRLQAIYALADIISTLAQKALFVFVLSTFIIFFNVAMALLIGEVLQSVYQGFLMVSLFYLMAAGVMYLFRNSLIKKSIASSMISLMMAINTKQQKIVEVIKKAPKGKDEKEQTRHGEGVRE